MSKNYWEEARKLARESGSVFVLLQSDDYHTFADKGVSEALKQVSGKTWIGADVGFDPKSRKYAILFLQEPNVGLVNSICKLFAEARLQ